MNDWTMEVNMWEYCEVRLVKGTHGGVNIKYFQSAGAPIELKTDPNFTLQKHETGLERAIAQLGREDWELIAKPSSEPYLFKRKIVKQSDYKVLVGFVKVV
ncbi:MAG: hypothetical protein KC646_05045 [Candidatus Cloacimonetes bacterium]|nr:hypothetical protein [Candidatus Cloacimonadota bacterium]